MIRSKFLFIAKITKGVKFEKKVKHKIITKQFITIYFREKGEEGGKKGSSLSRSIL